VRIPRELRLGAREGHGAAAIARARAHLDQVVGGLDERAVVLDDHHGVAGARELAAQLGESRGVARVEPDGGLVEDVERPHELGAQLIGEVDALRLAAGERARLPRQRNVAETDPQEERQLGAEQAQHVAGHRRLQRGEGEAVDEGGEVLDGAVTELGDGGPAHADGKRLRLEPRPRAAGAARLAPVARKEHAHVELVAVRLHLFEEALDAGVAVGAGVHPLAVGGR
jgi:hypothetical protein